MTYRSKEIQELHQLYLESSIWKKYNWYDFLEELLDILKKYE